MGGGFGGKETQAAAYAAACALVVARTGRPAKIRADRDDDMAMTGKRHDFTARYDVGFDGEGRIEGISLELASRGVPSSLIVAIWGMESNFGRFTGTRPVIQAVATLAWEGRRRAFFTAEFINAMQILDNG